MRIGLIADTHDRLDAVEKAIEKLNQSGVKLVLHAGDFVSPFTVLRFKQLKAKLHAVWGNNDGDKALLRRRLEELGAEVHGELAELELEGRKIVLLHGTSQAVVDALARSGLYDVVVRGHTHRAEVVKNGALVVNPGEVCGYLSNRQTLALLDLAELQAEILEL